jgi:hypothetical protein
VGDIEAVARAVYRRVIEATRLVVGGKLHFLHLFEDHGPALPSV